VAVEAEPQHLEPLIHLDIPVGGDWSAVRVSLVRERSQPEKVLPPSVEKETNSDDSSQERPKKPAKKRAKKTSKRKPKRARKRSKKHH